ncbi:MAG: DUF4338 domain-containing protein [Peptococcaceae bacterium]|nr:DUF4338 domain-containing protein [Peptococcaceae bacterium]
MLKKPDREYSGREFSAEDIDLIKQTVAAYPKLSQRELASTVCELIGWVQENGNPKRVQCVNFLRKMADDGEIRLPEPRKVKARNDCKSGCRTLVTESTWQDTSEVYECSAIHLEIARPGESLKRWRAYVREYHILGDPHVHGSQIRYTIKGDGMRDLGCMLFSASSWALSPRDEWIGWSLEDRRTRLHLVVNNSRFLLYPWVRVKNLASRALGQAARQIQEDWLREYCYAPVLMETFVDAPYKGTSYKASNWIYLGETKGRGRNDRHTQRQLTKKAIYVLALQRDFRAVLKGERPCKAVDPDDE